MQKTSTFLMFVGEQCGKAEEAVNFYISLFEDSKIKNIEYWKAGEPGGKEGLVKMAIFTLNGLEYMVSDSSAAHSFTFTPSMSIFVTCKNEEELETLYKRLSENGSILMELADYGFSKKFGWVADTYGVSWQVNLPA